MPLGIEELDGALVIADPYLASPIPPAVREAVDALLPAVQAEAREVEALEEALEEADKGDKDAKAQAQLAALLTEAQALAQEITAAQDPRIREATRKARRAPLVRELNAGRRQLGLSGTWYATEVPYLAEEDGRMGWSVKTTGGPQRLGDDHAVLQADDKDHGDWVIAQEGGGRLRNLHPGEALRLVRAQYFSCLSGGRWGRKRRDAPSDQYLANLIAKGSVREERQERVFFGQPAGGEFVEDRRRRIGTLAYTEKSPGEILSDSGDPRLAKRCMRPWYGGWRLVRDRPRARNFNEQLGMKYYQLVDELDYQAARFLEEDCLRGQKVWACYHTDKTLLDTVSAGLQSALSSVMSSPYIAGVLVIASMGTALPLLAASLGAPGVAAGYYAYGKVLRDVALQKDTLSRDLARSIVSGVLVPGWGPIAAVVLPKHTNSVIQKLTAEAFYTVPGFTSLVTHAEKNGEKRKKLRALFARSQQRFLTKYGVRNVLIITENVLSLIGAILDVSGIGAAIGLALQALAAVISVYRALIEAEALVNGLRALRDKQKEAYAAESAAADAEYAALKAELDAIRAQISALARSAPSAPQTPPTGHGLDTSIMLAGGALLVLAVAARRR